MAVLNEVDSAPRHRRTVPWSGLSPTVRYAVSRTLSALGTFLFVILFNFFLFRVMPGDPIALYTRGRNMDPDQIRALREKLDKTLGQQLIEYLQNPFSGSGNSIKFNAPVWEVITPRIPSTLLLVGTATQPVRLGWVRAAGKREMAAADWARGLRLAGEDVLA